MLDWTAFIVHVQNKKFRITVTMYILFSVCIAGATEAGLPLHVPRKSAPSGGETVHTSLPEFRSNNLEMVHNSKHAKSITLSLKATLL